LEQTATPQDSEVFGIWYGRREGPHDTETIAPLACAGEVNIQDKVRKVRLIEETTVSQIREVLPGTAEPPSKTQYLSALPKQEIFGYILEPPLTQHDEKAPSSKRPIADLLKAHALTLLWSVIMVLGLILALR
jgi:hypothetical protein